MNVVLSLVHARRTTAGLYPIVASVALRYPEHTLVLVTCVLSEDINSLENVIQVGLPMSEATQPNTSIDPFEFPYISWDRFVPDLENRLSKRDGSKVEIDKIALLGTTDSMFIPESCDNPIVVPGWVDVGVFPTSLIFDYSKQYSYGISENLPWEAEGLESFGEFLIGKLGEVNLDDRVSGLDAVEAEEYKKSYKEAVHSQEDYDSEYMLPRTIVEHKIATRRSEEFLKKTGQSEKLGFTNYVPAFENPETENVTETHYKDLVGMKIPLGIVDIIFSNQKVKKESPDLVAKKPPLRKANHPYSTKDRMIQRLSRIEGQIRGIAKMIADDVYCDEILHQFSSVESAIDGTRRSLLEAHIKGCITQQIQAGNLEVVDELLNTIKKMTK